MNYKKLFKKSKGFSLIELLVVIAIIGVLSAVGITAYSGYTKDAKVKVALANHKSLIRFITSEMYRCMGADTFVWGGNCTDVVDEVLLRNYLNNDLGMISPYNQESIAYQPLASSNAQKLARRGQVRVIMNGANEYPVVLISYIGPGITRAENIVTSIEKSGEVYSNAPWKHIKG